MLGVGGVPGLFFWLETQAHAQRLAPRKLPKSLHQRQRADGIEARGCDLQRGGGRRHGAFDADDADDFLRREMLGV
jgi:hypothetical protein